MTTISPDARFVERRKPRPKDRPKDYGWTLYLIVVTLLMGAGFFVSYDHLYEPGDDVGYNLGLAGSLMMLSLLVYPLRKRLGFMRNWGVLPRWFQWHMTLGVLGPAVIMFHSTFDIRSVNAGVAMTCMLLVSGSGIFGRFFYTKIHWGLYGRQLSYEQLQGDLEGYGNVKSIFSFAPEIQRKLVEFRDYALPSSKAGRISVWNFFMVDIRAKWFSRALVIELEDAMYASANERQWNDAQMKRLDELFYHNAAFIRSYLVTIRDIAQFSTYERLFAMWRFFHVPLVYPLVFSVIWHIIAVNKY
jgi:hypothetical protein